MQLRRSWIPFAAICFILTPSLPGMASSQEITLPLPSFHVMPLPLKTTFGKGEFVLDSGFNMVFTGYTEPRLERAKDRFFETLMRSTGLRRWPPASDNTHQFIVETKTASAPVQQLGEDESYRLEVTPSKVLLSAPDPLGVLRGLQTFLQLVHQTPRGFVVATLVIEDKPRFPWRGLMIDSGRHFMPPDIIRQNLDAMEAVKLNLLHWHVSEDQGFRIESKLFPKLQDMGSDGQYYTQDEVRSIIAYAHDRGIRVMPEFELPSHASSLFVGYPELGDGTGSYHLKRKLGESWNRKRDSAEDSSIDPTLESTYIFLDRFLGEMARLFPDAFMHVGGDAEDAILEWAANPRMRQYMQDHHIKDSAALQIYFTERLQRLVVKHHKTMVGWDEVLEPNTPKDVVIQSWRGLDSLAVAVGGGNRGILSWGYYLDLNEPASRHYAVDPQQGAIGKLTPLQQTAVLGGEAAMWTEYVTPETISGRIWPIAAAIAERLWSPQNTTDVDSMYSRLEFLSLQLGYRGLTYKSARDADLQRMVGNADVTSLKILASVVEPPSGYPREGTRTFTVYTPLNHLSDIIPAEADRAREFRTLTSRIATSTATSADLQLARQWLTLWRDNDASLQPLLTQFQLTVELIPVSHNLSRAAQIGLQALDLIEQHQSMTDVAQTKSLATLRTMEKSVAELRIMIIPGIEELVLSAGH